MSRQVPKKNNPYPPIVGVDFDGTIASYLDGWQGVDVFGELIEGAAECLRILHDAGFVVNLVTTRLDTPALRTWLAERFVPFDGMNSLLWNPPHTSPKPVFDFLLDDRAYPDGQSFDEQHWKNATTQILDAKGRYDRLNDYQRRYLQS